MIIMKTISLFKNGIRTMPALIPLALVLIISAYSCAGSKKSRSLSPSPPPPPPEEVFTVVEEMPQYPGGDEALMKFLMENIKYPAEAKEKNIQGRVIVRFVVNYQGNVEKVETVRGVDPLLDTEAVRVVSMLKGFTPGKQKGKPVNVWYSVPVTFQLTGEKAAEPPAAPPTPKSPQFSGKSIFEAGYDEPPVFPGGEKALEIFIESVKKYPQQAKINNITGTVVVGFTIDETGRVVNPFIFSGVNPELDNEAVRVVNSLTGWQPAKRNGKPVKASYRLAIPFR
jgi:TonB family protein